MKRLAILFLAVILVTSGCSGGGLTGGGKGGDMQKTFFDRTVSYTIDAGAKEHMTRLENMLAAIKKTEDPLTDEELLPLYRDTDMNRDHRITTREAESYSQEYVLKFEDSLGRARVKHAPQQETKNQ